VYGRAGQLPETATSQSMRYRLKTTIRTQTECIVRREKEAGCFVLLTNVPTAGTWPLALVLSSPCTKTNMDGTKL